MSITHDIALVFSPGWSPAVAREIAIHFPDRADTFTAAPEDLYPLLPNFPRWIGRFLRWRTQVNIEQCQKDIEKRNITYIGQNDPRYPQLLKEIHDPPLVLFVQGEIAPCTDWCAVVGSRNATAYGKTQAFQFGKELAERGVGIVSGLARGVDEHALRGACSANGNIIAVLAGGHLHTDERERELREIVVAHHGAIISEQLPEMHPQKYHFPIRNRIIAGIASRTLVVEGALLSGSLVTARAAMQENRDVFALPGPITSITSEGCNKLIKDGAGVCTSIYDLLGIAPPELQKKNGGYGNGSADRTGCKDGPPGRLYDHNPLPPTPHTPLLAPSHPTPLHQSLWNIISEPRTFDFLVEYAGEKGAEVAGILNIWEIEGYIALNHGRYHHCAL